MLNCTRNARLPSPTKASTSLTREIYGNIVGNHSFSINLEWMVSQLSQRFIDRAVDEEENDFCLYFSSTSLNSMTVYDALLEYTSLDSPKRHTQR